MSPYVRAKALPRAAGRVVHGGAAVSRRAATGVAYGMVVRQVQRDVADVRVGPAGRHGVLGGHGGERVTALAGPFPSSFPKWPGPCPRGP